MCLVNEWGSSAFVAVIWILDKHVYVTCIYIDLIFLNYMETLIVRPTLGYTDLFQFDCKDLF